MKLAHVSAMMILTLAVSLSVPACMEGKAIGRTAIDATLAVCAAEHPDAETPEELRTFCGFADDLLPIMRDLLAAQKRGTSRLAAKHEFDAGVCLPADAGLDGSRK